MIVYCFLALTLMLALVAIEAVRRSLRFTRSANLPQLLLGVSLSAFVYLYGTWIYISAYGRYAFALAVLLIAIYSLIRRRRTGVSRIPQGNSLKQLPAACLLLLLDVLYFTGTAGPATYASLSFPLKGGAYFVLQGGKGLPANMFHYNSRRAAYAMDIVKLDPFGRRCRKVFSKKLDDYFIFGDTVYSPCDGIIQRAESSNPDNIPPHRERGPSNLNAVVIDGSAYTVFLGHLQQGKVFVREGELVRQGQPLALAGNSGMSLEPHLHIQVHARSRNGEPWYRQQQLFMLFDEKEYLLFETIDARQRRP